MKTKTPLLLITSFILFAALLRVNFVIYIGYVVAGVWLFSHWQVGRSLGKLQIEREFDPNAFLGERVPITIQIKNTSRLPVTWLQASELTAVNLRAGTDVYEALQLAGGDSAELHYTIRAQRRGYYQIGPLTLHTGDIFGFREATTRYRPDQITIYPRIVPIAQLRLPSRLPFGILPSKQRLYADPARPIGVRNFRSGDSLRQINWKVSGRYATVAGGGLMVKTLEPAISLATMLLLDLDRGAFERQDYYHYSEWAIVVAASLAAHLVSQRQAIGLATNGFDPLAAGVGKFDAGTGRLLSEREDSAENTSLIAPRTGRQQLMGILELLARIEANNTDTKIGDFATRATLNLSWGTTLIVISPNCDERVTHTLHHFVKRGYNPILLCIQPLRDFGRIQQRCQQLGFRAYHVLHEADLPLQKDRA